MVGCQHNGCIAARMDVQVAQEALQIQAWKQIMEYESWGCEKGLLLAKNPFDKGEKEHFSWGGHMKQKTTEHCCIKNDWAISA